jgi:hypothetical protein
MSKNIEKIHKLIMFSVFMNLNFQVDHVQRLNYVDFWLGKCVGHIKVEVMNVVLTFGCLFRVVVFSFFRAWKRFCNFSYG